MSGPGSRREEDQQGDGTYTTEVQGRKPGWISEEEVFGQGGIHVYPRIQGGCRAHGGCQSHFQHKVFGEADCTSFTRQYDVGGRADEQGYLALTLLMNEGSDMVRLVINSIGKDLEDHNEINNCLALHAIANLGGKEMAEALSDSVFRTMVSA
jgi:hypothetical protein